MAVFFIGFFFLYILQNFTESVVYIFLCKILLLGQI